MIDLSIEIQEFRKRIYENEEVQNFIKDVLVTEIHGVR